MKKLSHQNIYIECLVLAKIKYIKGFLSIQLQNIVNNSISP